jgi:hypothetical protein
MVDFSLQAIAALGLMRHSWPAAFDVELHI